MTSNNRKRFLASTPWGEADTAVPIGTAGILSVSTMSHGGYFVPSQLNIQVPMAWRAATWNQLGLRGWYEEDSDACLVPLIFPTLFPRASVARAASYFESWFLKRNLQGAPPTACRIPEATTAYMLGGPLPTDPVEA